MPKMVDPAVDFRQRRRGRRRISGRDVRRTDDGAVAFDNKLDTVAFAQSQAIADCLRDSDLSFATDHVRVDHLYLRFLQ